MSSDILLKKVKQLREITGVGFKDCKNAIDETKGDVEKSIELLRKKGIAKASKRMERVASEGLVCIYEKESSTETAHPFESIIPRTTVFGLNLAMKFGTC